jgi:DNA invertase Pin-like site-specific DNA recombinase
VIDFAQLLAWFTDARAALVILDPQIDTSSAAGRLVANVFAAVAAWEAETIAERTSVALQAKRSEGKAICRPSVADSPELVEKIQQLHAEGMSLAAIADELNDLGIPTVRGARIWRASSVQAALGYRRPKTTKRSADLPPVRRRRRAINAHAV